MFVPFFKKLETPLYKDYFYKYGREGMTCLSVILLRMLQRAVVAHVVTQPKKSRLTYDMRDDNYGRAASVPYNTDFIL